MPNTANDFAELENLIGLRNGPGVYEKLKPAHVGIAGCGGLGSNLAVILARAGVGKLTFIDFDIVEPSNLNRQQYFVDQIGMPKVQALAANLKRINPFVSLKWYQIKIDNKNTKQFFASCNFVAECFDDPVAKAEITKAMRRYLPTTPLVTVSGIAGDGPACTISCRRVFGNHFIIGDGVSAATANARLLASRVTLAAALQANVIIRWLLGLITAHQGE
ncbi:MAG: sulfur carrier protein ThiS adenylyltransferase ThiF [Deltaproteobacteria bacterium]|nr:sulfur carrier protein ThiS adenylyltransferase ThiF [Deltaproteobacteria bacterium]